ncbi:glycosyltransferase family A protein [Aquidulcibacter sp.]|uniref:glycosyltransferase family 2 protein n=1 Tax=Aquidulcibacter sp. TaxID=2052990 RepID=UPI0025C41800|nr:glycosyltransferase family A protein [Aquidulcibacter sp.]MCA3695822.1 glycosyltransferase family 2 protein [Aquidulcibacter sp.]
MKVSVIIPCYEMHGMGSYFLEQCLYQISSQTHRDVEVIVGDQSNNSDIKNLCQKWANRLEIRRVNLSVSRGSPSANLNGAVAAATGDILKILFQDDILSSPSSLSSVVDVFKKRPTTRWSISGFEHSSDAVLAYRPFLPTNQPRLKTGINTFGPPSTLAVWRADYVHFDPALSWMMDLETYGRMIDLLGPPEINPEFTVVSRLWSRQNTNELVDERKIREELLALQPPAYANTSIAQKALHHAHTSVLGALIERERKRTRFSEPLDRRLELYPIDFGGLVDQVKNNPGPNNPLWQQAVSLLISYYTSEPFTRAIIRELRETLDQGWDWPLAGLKQVLRQGDLNPNFPTRLLPITAPNLACDLTGETVDDISQIAARAGRGHVWDRGQARLGMWFSQIYRRVSSLTRLAGFTGVPRIHYRLPGEQKLRSTPSTPASYSGIDLVIGQGRDAVAALSNKVRPTIRDAGFLIQIDLDGAPIITTPQFTNGQAAILVVEQVIGQSEQQQAGRKT